MTPFDAPEKKGGWNSETPTTERPAPPKGQGMSHNRTDLRIVPGEGLHWLGDFEWLVLTDRGPGGVSSVLVAAFESRDDADAFVKLKSEKARGKP